MYFGEKVTHLAEISSPRVVSKIQIHRRYSILENLFMQQHQTELSSYKRGKKSTRKPTNPNLVMCSQTKKIH